MSVILIAVGLWNATLELSEKGFYAMSFVLSLFAAVAVQKNVRDLALFPGENGQFSLNKAGLFGKNDDD